MNPAPGFKKHPGHSVTTKPSSARVQVLLKGEVIADTREAVELHESLERSARNMGYRKVVVSSAKYDPAFNLANIPGL